LRSQLRAGQQPAGPARPPGSALPCSTPSTARPAGLAPLVSTCDFLVRAVKVAFPDGVRAMCCYSVRPGDKVAGDPGPLPHTIR
jgi:hypothetical protein